MFSILLALERLDGKLRRLFDRYQFIVALSVSIAAPFALAIGAARAQEMEPRSYALSPIDTNFLVVGYSRAEGDVLTDPSLPISNLRATINAGVVGYSRTFDLAGHFASAALALPYLQSDIHGDVESQGRFVARSGQGDIRLRFAASLLEGTAYTPAEFARREPTTSLGASLTIIAPTGAYDSTKLINVGSNRWTFRPEIGVSQPYGDWFVEGSAGVWIFTDNSKFFANNVRSQDPLMLTQMHVGYNFLPGLWLAFDGTFYAGGETSVNGIRSRDGQVTSRYGLTASVPFAEGLSAKFSWSTWLTTRNIGHFEYFSLALQYRWFDQ